VEIFNFTSSVKKQLNYSSFTTILENLSVEIDYEIKVGTKEDEHSCVTCKQANLELALSFRYQQILERMVLCK